MELERLDKIKRLVIVALVSDDELMETLVLKGSNAISIACGVGNRGSADIDFSMAGNFTDVAAAFAKIETVLVSIFAEEHLHVFEVRWEQRPSNTHHLSADLQSFWDGYSLEFKIADAEPASTGDARTGFIPRLWPLTNGKAKCFLSTLSSTSTPHPKSR